MPNTLVHLGLQGLASRLVYKRIDLKWVFLGCIIPDLPWIFRKLIVWTGVNLNIYDIHVYSVVQASLVGCLCLAAAFSLLSARPRLVFLILAVNSVFHLLLDAVEKKWGNGVHFFAPLDWQHVSFGWLWPDSITVAIISGFSLLAVIWFFMSPVSIPIRLRLRPECRAGIAILLIGMYLFAPLVLKDGPYSTDINSVATLNEFEHRVGKRLFMDREAYIRGENEDTVVTFARERLRIVGDLRAGKSTEVTLIAEFVEPDAIRIIELYEYQHPWRDQVTLVGLLLVLAYWLIALLREATG